MYKYVCIKCSSNYGNLLRINLRAQVGYYSTFEPLSTNPFALAAGGARAAESHGIEAMDLGLPEGLSRRRG
jgi:hypothetical protein